MIQTCRVWLTEAREVPCEDEPGKRAILITKHDLGLVRLDLWNPPFKPGRWISLGSAPEER